MPVDRTAEFRRVLGDAQNDMPETKRRKLSGRAVEGRSRSDPLNKKYLAEAYNVVRRCQLC